jgi:SAM-dependent methyltransferase
MDPKRPRIVPPWLRRAIPAPAMAPLRQAVCAGVDALDCVRGATDPLIPPCRLRVRVGCFLSFVRVERYLEVAEEFGGHLRQLAGLHEHSRVLDVGCGCGQIAAVLAGRLREPGAYAGFDPDPEAIAWCREHIASRHPHFAFEHADLGNSQYNPGGMIRADGFRFPYPDAGFDVVLLKSIFTHMPRREMRHYLREIRRVMHPDGRCLASFYLLNTEAHALVARGGSSYVFSERGEGCWILDPRTPDYAVAYDEDELRRSVRAAGLRILEPLHYGSWCGRAGAPSFQDLVVLASGT